MLILLSKPYTLHIKELPEGTNINVTNSYGKMLIAEGVAIEVDTVRTYTPVHKAVSKAHKKAKKAISKPTEEE